MAVKIGLIRADIVIAASPKNEPNCDTKHVKPCDGNWEFDRAQI